MNEVRTVTQFDPAGMEGKVTLNAWTCWDSTPPTAARTVRSTAMLGAGAFPAWGAYSVNTWVHKGPGWKIDESVARSGRKRGSSGRFPVTRQPSKLISARSESARYTGPFGKRWTSSS